jgi:glucosyl-3-phosphoglycerate synthase
MVVEREGFRQCRPAGGVGAPAPADFGDDREVYSTEPSGGATGGPSGGATEGASGGPRTFDLSELALPRLLVAKGSETVSVCIPARDESRTVGDVVRVVGEAHVAARGGSGLVDEVLVIDDGSTDGTAAVAREAGARVVRTGPGGKGGAMTTAVGEATGDLIVFLDADVEDTTEAFVTGLLGPLLLDADVVLVKGFYRRPLHDNPTGGGRVTELMARPLLEVYFPDLLPVHQPLAGETAARRAVLDKLTFASGYGVELGLLIDIADRFGPGAIAQVDLGVRTHRNRPIDQLRPQAVDILRAAIARAPSRASGGVPGDPPDPPGRSQSRR